MEKLRIFVVSPSDMKAERAKVEKVAESLEPLAEHLEIVLKVDDWSEVVPNMGRPEQVILDQIKPDSWDVLIGILWHRFGTPPEAREPQTQKEYLSGTEEEFMVAYRLWQQHGRPRIVVYRCLRAIPPDALDPDQFKRIKDFFAQFEAKEEHPGIYQSFDTTEAFEQLLFDNLQKLLLDYSEKLKGKPVEPEVVQTLAPKHPDNLPRRAPFFGRDKEMEVVLRALSPEDRTWGILLDGIGGIGKSALAIEAAYRCKEKGLFNAFVFVSAKENILDPEGIRELKPVARTLDEFLNETARILNQASITKLAGDAKRRALLDAFRGTRALLIYDNLETLAKGEQEALADFLRELPPECKAITTSRRRGGEGAVWLRLEKLEWDAARSIIQSEMARDPQLAKKLERPGEARWQELYDETKGSPLALMHTLGLMRVRATLTFDGALDLLRGNRSPDLQKFIFREARKELTANDESALRALSFFVPSATFEAWVQVSELSRNALETATDRLSALSLVDILAGEERYTLHPLTRNFVRDELLSDAQIARETGIRFASYWRAYAQQYGGFGKENYKTYDRLEIEWANIDAATERLWQMAAVRDGKVGDEPAARILYDFAEALFRFLWYGGRWDEVIKLNVRAYEVMNVLNEWNRASWCAHKAAAVYYYWGNEEEAERWAALCAESSERGGSKYHQANSMHIQGLLTKDYNTAERLLKNALEMFRDLKDEETVVIVLNDLGRHAYAQELFDVAKQHYDDALKLAEALGLKEAQAFISTNLGELAGNRKDWAEARRQADKALLLSREVGRRDLVASNLYNLAVVSENEGSIDLALQQAQEALTIYERLRHPDLDETRELVEKLKAEKSNEQQAEPPSA